MCSGTLGTGCEAAWRAGIFRVACTGRLNPRSCCLVHSRRFGCPRTFASPGFVCTSFAHKALLSRRMQALLGYDHSLCLDSRETLSYPLGYTEGRCNTMCPYCSREWIMNFFMMVGNLTPPFGNSRDEKAKVVLIREVDFSSFLKRSRDQSVQRNGRSRVKQ